MARCQPSGEHEHLVGNEPAFRKFEEIGSELGRINHEVGAKLFIRSLFY